LKDSKHILSKLNLIYIPWLDGIEVVSYILENVLT